jgi:hypothetical protein
MRERIELSLRPAIADVAFGSIASVLRCPNDFRFPFDSGGIADFAELLIRASCGPDYARSIGALPE